MKTKLNEDVFYNADQWPDRPVPRPRGAVSACELLGESAADLLEIARCAQAPKEKDWWLTVRVKNTVVEGGGALRRYGAWANLGPEARLLTFPAFSCCDPTERWESGGWDGHNHPEAGVSFVVWARRKEPSSGMWSNVAILGHLHADAPEHVARRDPAQEGRVNFGPEATLNWGVARSPEEFAWISERIDVEGYNGRPARKFFERVAQDCPQWELLAPSFYILRAHEARAREAREREESELSALLQKGEPERKTAEETLRDLSLQALGLRSSLAL